MTVVWRKLMTHTCTCRSPFPDNGEISFATVADPAGVGTEKHEIYAGAFGVIFYMTYFHRAGGGGLAPSAPLDPLLC